jgi:hypothetical protein
VLLRIVGPRRVADDTGASRSRAARRRRGRGRRHDCVPAPPRRTRRVRLPASRSRVRHRVSTWHASMYGWDGTAGGFAIR